jgi:hypothetical protein
MLALQTKKWVAFGIAQPTTRTIVHFFPSEGGVSAPYPATCALRIFGTNLVEKRVVIEGARLSHPDGVRLDQAFPVLAAENLGLFGLEIEVATIQPRVDVSPSSCVVEFITKGQSVRFWPTALSPQPTLLRPEPELELEQSSDCSTRLIPLIKDPFANPALIIVNGSTEHYTPQVKVTGHGGDIFAGNGVPGSCSEVPCDESLFSQETPRETSWGLVRLRTLVTQERSSHVSRGAFLLYREPLSRRPVSVLALSVCGPERDERWSGDDSRERGGL